MKTWHLIALGAFAVLVGDFYFGWVMRGERIVERQVEIPAHVNIDSLHDVWAFGRPDSLDLEILEVQNANLKRLLSERPIGATAGGGGTSQPPAHVTVRTWTIDTALPVGVETFVDQGEELVPFDTTTRLSLKTTFYGDPLNAFRIESAKIDPFTLTVKAKETVIHEESTDWFHLRGLTGWHADPAFGLHAEFFQVGFGAMAIVNEKPLYFVSFRLK